MSPESADDGLHHSEIEHGTRGGIEVRADLARLGPRFRRRAIIVPDSGGPALGIEITTEGGGQRG